jgi:hypothetical protein
MTRVLGRRDKQGVRRQSQLIFLRFVGFAAVEARDAGSRH